MTDSPEADATINEWQEWAASQTGIKLNKGTSVQNPKLFAYIFKHRFPKYTAHLNLEDAIDPSPPHVIFLKKSIMQDLLTSLPPEALTQCVTEFRKQHLLPASE